MKKEDVVEFVWEAVNHVETNTPEPDLVKGRVKMAAWLWSNFRIGIKNVFVNANDGLPYLKIDFVNDNNEREDAYVSLEKFKLKIARELSANGSANDDCGETQKYE